MNLIIYKISKEFLSDRDLKDIKFIKYDNDRLILVQIAPRKKPGDQRRKVIIDVPANDTNWKRFKDRYFENNTNSNI